MTRNQNLDGDRGAKVRAAGVKARQKQADARATDLAPIIAEIRARGVTSMYGIARALNERGIPTATGRGAWKIPQIRRMLARIKVWA